MSAQNECVLITCEHGGNEVPEQYRRLFAGYDDVLAGHRGYDPGTLTLARAFARHFQAPLFFSTTTRLLVELNRSPRHRALFSEFTAPLDAATKRRLLDEFYQPYRRRVATAIAERIAARSRVVHISVHSFTPELNGIVRTADVGLLYDPRRAAERTLCLAWQKMLSARRPDLRVRRNYPYLGTSDGFTTSLRRHFGADCYAGIELEVNQNWPAGPPAAWSALQTDVIAAFELSLQRHVEEPDR